MLGPQREIFSLTKACIIAVSFNVDWLFQQRFISKPGSFKIRAERRGWVGGWCLGLVPGDASKRVRKNLLQSVCRGVALQARRHTRKRNIMSLLSV